MTFNRSDFISPDTIVPAHVAPGEVHATLGKHMLVDGFEFVVDLKRSHGARIYDSRTDEYFLDFFSFFASSPIGLNHPKMFDPDFLEHLTRAAINKPSSSDTYTTEMADFVETFFRLAVPEYFEHLFLIEGGALAVENALKTAFDWKVRKNFARGAAQERGHTVIYLQKAFHGRSGYTLSITNTDPNKTKYFPKFGHWVRIVNPVLHFPITEEGIAMTVEQERQAMREIEKAFLEFKDDICAIIIEPIQGEGGDNHFRKEFLQQLRTIASENEVMLIVDEVQTGVGLTGKMWAHEWFDIQPDILAFGKKMQVCGILANKRVDEVEDNVFQKPGRINSTWGGNLVDIVRAKRYLEIIDEEQLVDHARTAGEYFVGKLGELERDFPWLVTNARGRGLFAAMDMPNDELRQKLRRETYKEHLILIGSGERSIRFRPPLNLTRDEVDEGIMIIRNSLRKM